MDKSGEPQPMNKDIIWLSHRHSLTDIMDNFKLPILVKVSEGFMLDEESCLDSDTILTIRGEQNLKHVLASDQRGKQLRIPLNCKYRFRIKTYDEIQIYETIRDVISSPYLPVSLENKKEFRFHGAFFPIATTFDVRGIYRGKYNEPQGLSVVAYGSTTLRMTLPLGARGSFISIPLRQDRLRTYLISEITKRNFPIFIEFIQTNERNAIYSPRLGTVHIRGVHQSRIAYATSIADSKTFFLTFPRNLKVELQIGQKVIEEDGDNYSAIVEPEKDPPDEELLKYLSHADPYSGDFNTVCITDVEKDVITTKRTLVDENQKAIEKPPIPARAGSRRITQRQGSTYVPMRAGQDDAIDGPAKPDSFQPRKYEEICIDSNKYSKPNKDKECILKDTNDKELIYTTIEETANRGLIRNVYTPEPITPKKPPRVPEKPKSIGQEEADAMNYEKQSKEKSTDATENPSQSDLNSSSNLVKVLAFSLPLDAAANLQVELDNVKPDTSSSRGIRPPMPLPKTMSNSANRTVSGMRQDTVIVGFNDSRDEDATPPPVPPRKTSMKSESKSPQQETKSALVKKRIDNVDIKNDGLPDNEEAQADASQEDIAPMTIEAIGTMLDSLNMSNFAETFKEHQIDGELIKDLEEEDLVESVGMTAFQARKLLLYVRGWRTDEETAKEGSIPSEPDKVRAWTAIDVSEQLQLIKVPLFAAFCMDNQVNGSLLSNILDEEMIKSIREDYGVKLSRIEEKRLRNFVIKGWRPTSMCT